MIFGFFLILNIDLVRARAVSIINIVGDIMAKVKCSHSPGTGPKRLATSTQHHLIEDHVDSSTPLPRCHPFIKP